MLIVNADDWGRSAPETDAALTCFRAGRVTSVSAMVFMLDSERASVLAVGADLPVGLHLNVCERFSGLNVPRQVSDAQDRVVRFIRGSKYSFMLYNPLLRRSFALVCQAQIDEFVRLYGRQPTHVDGHQHKHLATNILLAGLLPKHGRVRRGFHFWPGEKSLLNRLYRGLVDRWLLARYRTTDYFFALSQCIKGERLDKIFALARTSRVELMVHPASEQEREFLLGAAFGERLAGISKGSYLQI